MNDVSLIAPRSLVLQKLIVALTSIIEAVCGLQVALLIALSVALELKWNNKLDNK